MTTDNNGVSGVPPLTKEEIREEIQGRVSRISKEFKEGFEFIANYPRSVTFFGSSRFDEENEHYKKARILAGKIVKEFGYTVLTGGSKGIMEAANRGAFEAGGESVGLNIRLPKIQYENKYTTASIGFSYFFARKVALSFAAEAYIYFPGGFGTLDELSEIITLVQTRKIDRIPVILIGREFWSGLDQWFRAWMFERDGAVDEEDLFIYTIVDTAEEAMEIVRKAPPRDGF